MKIKTCGRETSCELVVEHPTVSRLHARIELAGGGLVSVQDADSRNGTFLNRNETWVRVKRVTLCVGDRIRFGDCEVPLERLTAVFGSHANARLEARHFPFRRGHVETSVRADMKQPGARLLKPRRNPATGKIEERS